MVPLRCVVGCSSENLTACSRDYCEFKTTHTHLSSMIDDVVLHMLFKVDFHG